MEAAPPPPSMEFNFRVKALLRKRLHCVRVLVCLPLGSQVPKTVPIIEGNRSWLASIKKDEVQIANRWLENFLGLSQEGSHEHFADYLLRKGFSNQREVWSEPTDF
ncbi:hypothetical protein QYF36_005485 [Acer negundo]|nr:hypothetical protein QYF36_005485 [Acer negundo]